jgi:uncharacterized iron-regulated protein
MKFFLLFSSIFLTVLIASASDAEEKLPFYELSVSFDLNRGILLGRAKISLPPGKDTLISLGSLNINAMILNGRHLSTDARKIVFKAGANDILEITYDASFKEENGKEENLENVGVVAGGLISPDGISLTGLWYPEVEGLSYYSLKALVPEGFKAVSEADRITETDTPPGKEYSFYFPHPVDGINFAAGKYIEKKEIIDGIEIYGYFFPEDIGLAETYIEHAKKYLSMYENLIGPYEYKRFSIVENMLPTGYSMPSFTLLGKDVVRLPFITETSLGHEILHQWFGNLIYGDNSKGNWLEGLTTYLSDHLYEEQKGAGWDYRKKILIDYQSYVNPGSEIPLKEFLQRKDFATRAIGYGKGAMLFHMLKNLIGDGAFYGALKGLASEKKFAFVSWDGLMEAFEKSSGKDLGWFFDEWLTRKGLPSFEIKNPMALYKGGKETVSFEVIQKEGEKPYRFELPVRIITDKSEKRDTLKIEKEKEYFEIPVDAMPIEVVFDEDYDTLRSLAEDECPPVIGRLLGDAKRLIALPESKEVEEKFSTFIELLKANGFEAKNEKDVKDEDIKASSILVLERESPILKRLFGGASGEPEMSGPEFSLTVIGENPLNSSHVIAEASATSKDEVNASARKIFRYGKYSSIRFSEGKNTLKDITETKRGIRFSLIETVAGISPGSALGLDEIIKSVVDGDIIYVGESHTNYEDHKVQLEVIKAMHKSGGKFAIGMEMFQRPFQKALDDYIAGIIGEKEFLKSSEYFKRWSFDYMLYREIMDFARSNKIPVIALNLKSEIIKKVSKGGLDALGEDERAEIPSDMSMADEAYRERIKEVFEKHENPEERNFDYFYQSQLLWDETMAHTIDKYLADNPGYRMVVLSGVGHVQYGSGIPKRAYRLNGKKYAILINSNIDTLDADIADFVLFPKPIPLPETPKLMAVVKEEEGKAIAKSFPPGSVSGKAGMRENDIVVSIDGIEIKGLDDIRIALFDKRHGDTVTVNVLRKRLLFKDKEIELKVIL